MNYKYNETAYAELIFHHGFQSPNHMPTELRLLAIYMRRNLGYKSKKLKEELCRWCETHIENYHKASYYQIMNRAVSQAVKKGSALIQVDEIPVYESEFNFIRSCRIQDENGKEYEHSHLCQKLMFTLLVQLKINKAIAEIRNTDADYVYNSIFFKGGQAKYAALKKMAKLPEKIRINEDLIHHLYVSGHVTPLYGGMIRLDFMAELYKKETSASTSILLTDFDRTGWYYDYLCERNQVILCRQCRLPFKKKSNRQEYCSPDCSSTARRLQKNLWEQSHRRSPEH